MDLDELKRRAGITESKEADQFFFHAAELLRKLELDPRGQSLRDDELDHMEGFATELANAVSKIRMRRNG